MTVPDKFKSRKLVVALVLEIVATVAMFLAFADFTQWIEFTKWNVMFYFGANTLEHFSEAWKANSGNKYAK